VNPNEVRSALNDLARGLHEPTVLPAPGKQLAKDLLVRALGPEVGNALGDELDVPTPFAWLAEADPETAGQALAKEPAGAVALALAHVDPRAAARLLAQLPPETQARVATRIAGLGTVHPDTVRQVEATVRARVSDLLQTSVKKVDGPELLAGVLAKIGREAGKELLHALAATNPELAAATRDRLFTFEDLCGLEARTLQTVLRAVDSKQLAMALRSLDAGLVDAVMGNLSERAREALTEEMELITSSRPNDVADARTAVVAAARQLEDDGTVVLMKDAEEA